jgi:hypothetical protein
MVIELEKLLDNANNDEKSEICKVIESSLNAGAPLSVLREKLKEYRPKAKTAFLREMNY